jgi:type I restriction enzyme, S subunit
MKLTPTSDLCSRISSGGTPSRKRDEYFSAANDSGHLWVKSKELLDCSIAATEETITDEGLKKSAAKYFPAQTVLVAMYGANVGQLGWLANPATVNQAICGLVADENKADWRYLFYALLQERAKLITKAQGAAQQNLNQDAIRNFELPIPSLPTQRKIAGILSAYDDLIENNLRRIEILEQMAQSLYREWFVHFRFPGHESADFADSSLGQIPKGWEVKKLETLYRTSSGGTPSRKNLEYYEEGTIDWVKTGELKDCFILSSEEKITAQALSKSSAKLFPANTVLIALYGATIGQLGILSREAATNQACCAILEVEQPFGRAFAYLTLLLRRDDIIGLRLGAAQQNISQAVLRDFEVICPPATLLEAFNQRAEPMFDLLLNLQSRNQTLRRTRDLLLPKLLSGDQNLDGIRP